MAEPELWYRLGSAQEQALLTKYRDSYQGLVIPAHILAWGRAWVTSLLNRLAKPFLIDPMTYVFSQTSNLIQGERGLKKSYDALLNLCGAEVSKLVRRRPLRPADLIDDRGGGTSLLTDFVSKVIDLQVNLQESKSPTQQSLDKYRQLLGEDTHPDKLAPHTILVPYFHFDDMDDPWYNVDKLLVREALRQRKGRIVQAVVATSSSSLQSVDWTRVSRDFGDTDGIVLWISGQSEAKRSTAELTSLKHSVRALRSTRLKVHLMHAGYYSLCMALVGASRITSGIGYGESKEVTARPTGGGFPPRYYLDLVKRQSSVENVRTLLSDHPALLCSCSACSPSRKAVGIKVGAKPTLEQLEHFFDGMDDDDFRAHYLLRRFQESQLIGGNKIKQVSIELAKLCDASAKLRLDNYRIPYKHLKNWSDALGAS